jgi:UDP-N-acetylglucosamine 2-epimerase (non-hydrolysing)
MRQLRIISVAGARPNFMKIAPLMKAFGAHREIDPVLVHTGQHYDERMSDLFFRDLGIPKPDVNLGVGSGSHAQQTAAIMTAFEPIVLERKPDMVLVVGDVNGTVACSLVAAKLGIKVAHVEAGLRSHDRTMPEEINRVLTDAISDVMFVTERSGVENLSREGISAEKVHLVGNVMIDSLLAHRKRAEQSGILAAMSLQDRRYALLTLHRPSNVDNPETLEVLLGALEEIQKNMPLVFPVHPRTRKNLATFGLADRMARWPQLRLVEPLGYLEFLGLMGRAAVVLTDSGGIQEETTVLGVPCLTLRDNTERPITVEQGTNRLVGRNPGRILAAFREAVSQQGERRAALPELWDGHAAERIADVLVGLAPGRA